MRRLLLLVLFILFIVSFPDTVFAEEGWEIERFNSKVVIESTGEVAINETISVDFNSLSKHGIFRDIPYIYESSDGKYYTEISVEDVLQNNQRARFETLKNEGNIRVKIGDPDETVSGKNTYTIQYRAKGILRGFEGHDELYWNVTGNNWDVPVRQVTTEVVLSAGNILQIACYQGYSGSRGECHSVLKSPMIAEFYSIGNLDAQQGMSIVVGYKKGVVPILTVAKPQTIWDKFLSWPSEVTLFFSLLFGIGTIIYIWYKNGRDFWNPSNPFTPKHDKGVVRPIGGYETVVAEFTPPEKLRPAELGVLMDERADTLDVVATIIDLAGRGYLTIHEVPKKWIFGKNDYILKRLKTDAKELMNYERLLLNKLFEDGSEQTLSGLKEEFYEELLEIKKTLYEEVVIKHMFPSNPEKVRQKYLIIAAILFFVGLIIGGYSILEEMILLADIGLGVLISGLLLGVFSRSMPRRSAYGRNLYRRARGYQLFIGTAEKYRQRFFEDKNLFNDVLPYAIVFGLTTKFAKQMHDMGIKPPQPGWYVGPHHFNSTVFASSVNDFSRSMSSAIAATPQGSGLSGGGGFSGGGLGGGGGGSW